QSHRALSEHKTLSISWSHYRQSIRVRMGVCFVPKANVANSALFSDGAVETGTATVQSAKANTLPLRG
ncbi:hypothetical protein, partial [Escherichia coli]|uniref:hypothetical protein n=1 Tax=Escherichia coli TaxID=562 RepID=UPI00098CD6F9